MKRFFAALLALLLLLSLTACTSRVPPLNEVRNYSEAELLELCKSVSEKDLISKWGQPLNTGWQLLWPADEGSFVVAQSENGWITLLAASQHLYVTVVEIRGSTAYGLTSFTDHTTDPGMLTFLPGQDYFGNEITYELGDLYEFEFDGILMETYPMQIRAPYAAEKTGRLTQEELAPLQAEIFLPEPW